ncbi:MAG: pyridoxamine 5'-phosphate oxidase [Bacteroidetes bacterium]|nr:pyridoxamine 5'-phosphate oxidase [Bacteroidota bacterium]
MSTRTYPDLDERIMHADPIVQFQHWFDDAEKAGITQPEAMTLATASADGRPSARVVLLKLVDERGFVFYTNYDSRKGKELSANPVAALVFFWEEMNRSVRVEGNVTKLSPYESDEYFATRPRDGQLSSLTSSQSEVVESREVLDRRFEELKKEYEGKTIARPPHWGGYRVYPVRIEFWQQRFARLNDRIVYQRRSDGSWLMQRLQP